MIPKFRAWFDSEMYDKPVVCDDECHRLWKDYEELEAKHEKVVAENESLKDKCVDLMLENADYVWDEIARETANKRANTRRWRAKQ